MKKTNKFITFGLLFNAIYLLGNHIKILPDLIQGLIAGLGIGLLIFGMYSENHDMSRFKNYKKNLLNRMLSK